jgi:hypothetical protein
VEERCQRGSGGRRETTDHVMMLNAVRNNEIV